VTDAAEELAEVRRLLLAEKARVAELERQLAEAKKALEQAHHDRNDAEQAVVMLRHKLERLGASRSAE
jgi:hypothetical protein